MITAEASSCCKQAPPLTPHTLTQTDSAKGRADDLFPVEAGPKFHPTPQHTLSLSHYLCDTLAVKRLWLVQSNTSAGRLLPKEHKMAMLWQPSSQW